MPSAKGSYVRFPDAPIHLATGDHEPRDAPLLCGVVEQYRLVGLNSLDQSVPVDDVVSHLRLGSRLAIAHKENEGVKQSKINPTVVSDCETMKMVLANRIENPVLLA